MFEIDLNGGGEWTPLIETRWKIRTCIQDVNENDLDSAHLRCLHQFTSKTPEEMDAAWRRWVAETYKR